jgi:hypothetical protein
MVTENDHYSKIFEDHDGERFTLVINEDEEIAILSV